MGIGPGFTDSEGVWIFGEDDTETLMSDLLNLGMDSVSQQLTLDRARLTALEADTGWITVSSLSGGWSVHGGSTPQYRRTHGIVFLRGRIEGGSGTAFVLPAGFRPGAHVRFAVMHSTSGATLARVTVAETGAVEGVNAQIPNLSGVQFIADA